MVPIDYPSVTMSHPYKNVYELKGLGNPLTLASAELKRIVRGAKGKIVHESLDPKTGRYLVVSRGLRCLCYRIMNQANCRSVTAELERHNCIQIQPTIFQEGWEHRHIVAFKDAHLKKFLKTIGDFCDIQITSKGQTEDFEHGIFSDPAARLFESLTEKQAAALSHALENGYYDLPRKVTVERLSGFTGVPRSTYEEHLHKAESKLLRSLGPSLQAFTLGEEASSRIIPPTKLRV